MLPVELPALPAVVTAVVKHRRFEPIVHDVRSRVAPWLVDVDDLPPPGLLASFRRGDHLDRRGATLRGDVELAAAEHGAAVEPSDRIVLLATPRSLGCVFNPLSVYWCVTAGGLLRWALLEVHNTYGERHHRIVELDADGRGVLEKRFYVSPFLEVSGTYRVRLQLDRERVEVRVDLEQAGAVVLAARLHGRIHPATTTRRVWSALRVPFSGHQTLGRIYAHGVWLWLRRLPVEARGASRTPQ